MDSLSRDVQPLATATVGVSESASIVICETVSEAAGTPIDELPPLGRTLDPDAVDALFPADESRGSLVFQYAGHDVVVTSDGTIEVFREATLTN